jgi:tRNA threonylcarbamoyladenosine biosynthesis protein TsaE
MVIKFFKTESDLLDFAAHLATIISVELGNAQEKTAFIIFLSGPLGAGKTTFTRGFLRGLGYHKKVKSPTYTLVEPYEVKNLKIFHFDLYRINDAKELDHIGIHDYFLSPGICLIEWPENGNPLLPSSDLSCQIAFKEAGREICLYSHSERGEKILLNHHRA